MKKSQKSSKRLYGTTIKRKEKHQLKLTKDSNHNVDIRNLSIEKINEFIHVVNELIQKELYESKD